MGVQNDIERDQYDRINDLTARVENLAGVVESSQRMMEKMLKQLERNEWAMFFISMFAIAALTYGALGERGFNAVRNSVKIPEVSMYDALPPHSDVTLVRGGHVVRIA